MILGSVLADYRWANGLGVRALAKAIGISPATLNRVERGENCDAITLSRVLVWLLGEPRISEWRAGRSPKEKEKMGK